MTKMTLARSACACAALVAFGLGCGADSVDVGDRPEPVGGGDPTASPDAGGSLVEGDARCNIPSLGQYRLVFDSDGGRLERRIYSMRADGTDIEPLTPPEELAREPALSPDGKQLAYATPDGIHIRDMASGQSELIAPGADQPRWSPDGTLLYFRTVSSGNCIEQMIVADRVVPDGQGYFACGESATSIGLTPDGSSILYVSSSPRGDRAIQGHTLYIIPLSAGVSTELVPPGAVAVESPTVSPDGVWVAAAYECDAAGSSIWASPLGVPTRACEGRRITPDGIPSATNPDWGPDLLIAYERGEPPRDIAIIAADTGEECVIPGLGDDRNPSWGIFATSVPE